MASVGAIVGGVLGGVGALVIAGVVANRKAKAATSPPSPGPPEPKPGATPSGVLMPADTGKTLVGVKAGDWFIVQADPAQTDALRSGWADVFQVDKAPGLQRDSAGTLWQVWTVTMIANVPQGKTEILYLRDPQNPQNQVSYGFTEG